MNTTQLTINTGSTYCAGCDIIADSHICSRCSDYTITILEAMQAGFLMTITDVANCNCDICD